MLRASRFDRHGGPDPLEAGATRPADEAGNAGAGDRVSEPTPSHQSRERSANRTTERTDHAERTKDAVVENAHRPARAAARVTRLTEVTRAADAAESTEATRATRAAEATRRAVTRTRAVAGRGLAQSGGAARRGLAHTGHATQVGLAHSRRAARKGLTHSRDAAQTGLVQSRDLARAGLVQARRAQTTVARRLDRTAGATPSGQSGRPADPALPAERTVRENFPVALRILPARHRTSLGAVYRYARLVDDIGDEAPTEARGRLLDQVDRDIDAIYAGRVPGLPALQAMREVVREHDVPEEPLRKLVQANRQDQEVLRYETWDQLVEYCTLSADPVGHLVLYVFGAATPDRIELSNRICTALQVIEHCQDVAEDFGRGRVYLPAEDLRVFGCTDADLGAAATPTRLRGALTRVADRASALLDEGEPLVRGLDGWAGVCVAGYVAGGRATLAALRAGAYDVHARRLRPSRVRTLGEALLVLGGK